MFKVILLAALLPTLVSAHTLTLEIHKNNNELSSGTVQCYSVEHCKYLIKVLEYKNKGECLMLEVKDRGRVVYQKRYKN